MQVHVEKIIKALESWAPPGFQESYDNSGLQLGEEGQVIKGVLVTLDVTEEVVREALKRDQNLIISHHPLIFRGLKRISNRPMVQRCVRLCIKSDIAVYSLHTNLDNVFEGVNTHLASKLDLTDLTILDPKDELLAKLVVYVPVDSLENVRNALFEAGAGKIGGYDRCSFQMRGHGSFRPGEDTNPHSGTLGKEHLAEEVRLEVILYRQDAGRIAGAMMEAHPYEQVAYDLVPLLNEAGRVGAGVAGHLREGPAKAIHFFEMVKERFGAKVIRHSHICKDRVHKVAICGGSGHFLIPKAKKEGCDAFITADLKYHDFFEAEGEIILVDIGHFESENHVKELVGDFLKLKFPSLPVSVSQTNPNPVNYF